MSAEFIDRLSNVIREVDGGHSLGAGALAEAITEHLLADPAPLPAALAESGVLSEERRLVCSCGSVRGGAWKPHFEGDDHELAKEWRYVSDWTKGAS